MQENIRAPLVEGLLGPGRRFELEEVEILGRRRPVFRGRLAIDRIPRTIYSTIDPPPLTATGKIDRGLFLRRALGR